jgi:hypothetical protein
VAAVAVAAVEAAEDSLSAKAAGNESVDGRMTACDEEIGRWTTTNSGATSAAVAARLAAARWQQRGSCGGGGSAKARRWRQASQCRTECWAEVLPHVLPYHFFLLPSDVERAHHRCILIPSFFGWPRTGCSQMASR